VPRTAAVSGGPEYHSHTIRKGVCRRKAPAVTSGASQSYRKRHEHQEEAMAGEMLARARLPRHYGHSVAKMLLAKYG
jgi:hypothetical protein